MSNPLPFFNLAPSPTMKAHFDKMRENLELSTKFQDEVSTRHKAIRSAIANISSSIQDTKLIGSLQRKTRIQPLDDDEFDIDILVVMGSFYCWTPPGAGVSAHAAQTELLSTLHDSDRYSQFEPRSDAPTVTLQFERLKVELVPAYRDQIGVTSSGKSTLPLGRGYWVPTSNGWEIADYDLDASEISRLNAACGMRLVPTIKMLKAIKRHRFPQLKSWALEILAAQIVPVAISLRAYEKLEPYSDSELLQLFFDIAKGILDAPLSLVGSNSPPVTLTRFETLPLRATFSQISSEIAALERLTSQRAKAEGWRRIFGDCFPALVWI